MIARSGNWVDRDPLLGCYFGAQYDGNPGDSKMSLPLLDTFFYECSGVNILQELLFVACFQVM